MNSIAGKIVVFAISLFLILFITFQLVRYVHQPYKTESAFPYTISDNITAKGVSIKNESIFSLKSSEGVIGYHIKDGSKVAKEESIGYLYSNKEDANIQLQIDEINTKLINLEKAQNKGALVSARLDTLSDQINQNITCINQISSTGFTEDISKYKQQFSVYSNRRDLVIGSEEDFSAYSSQLESTKQQLQAQLQKKPEEIFAPQAGYFVSHVDGLENVLTADSINSLTVKQIEDSFTNTFTSEELLVGKFSEDYAWRFAAIIPNNVVEMFTAGRNVYIKFPFNSADDVPATVEKIVEDPENSENKIAVLYCKEMTEKLSQIRSQTVQISFGSYSGLKVPKKALRMNGTEKGVYIKSGNELEFKKLDVVYENDTVIISKENSSKDFLQRYDEVVVEGKGIYNEKAVQL